MYATVPIVAPTPVRSTRLADRGVRRLRRRLDHLGQPEIQHLRLAAIGDEDVGRLDVAMDDPLDMRRLERIRDLDRQFEHGLDRERRAADRMLERLPLEQTPSR